MRKISVQVIWALMVLITGLIAGCGRQQASALDPAVIATSPANGANDVTVSQVITATFNEVMNATTVNMATFTVTGPGGTPVTGAVTYSGTTAIFTPIPALTVGKPYDATITTGAADLAGNGLASNFVWSFTTGAPGIISTVPANN